MEEIRQLFSENNSCLQTSITEQPSENPTSEHTVFSSLISPNEILQQRDLLHEELPKTEVHGIASVASFFA